MSKILILKSSPSGENSVSNKLVDAIAEKIKSGSSVETVTETDLAVNPIPHIDGLTVGAFYTPPENRNDLLNNAVKVSDEAIGHLMGADIIVIGVPIHNFGIPSTLKAWVDHISRVGVTFHFDETGMPQGMIHGKKVVLAIASGGVYSDGPMKQFDHTEPYLRAILGYLGITNITVVRAEGSSIPGLMETSLSNGLAAVDALAF